MRLTSALSFTDRAFKLFMTAVLAASSLVVLASSQVFAATKTWTGAGGNNNFSTAANWSDNSVPVNGDSLSFNVSSLAESTTLNNDINGLSVVSVNFSGSSEYGGYIIGGQGITVSTAITSTVTLPDGTSLDDQMISAPILLDGNVSLSNVNLFGGVTTNGHLLSASAGNVCGIVIQGLAGNGAVTIASTPNDSSVNIYNGSFTGAITANTGTNVGIDARVLNSASSLTATDARLVIGVAGENRSVATPLTVSGSLFVSPFTGTASQCGGSGGELNQLTLALTGGLSLNGDLEYSAYRVDTTVSQPYDANSHAVTVKSGSSGNITLPTGTLEVAEETKEYNDNKPNESISVSNKQTAIINGTLGHVSVSYGGILKGTGTISALSVGNGGVVAPGLSPGQLTILDYLHLSQDAVFEVEIQSLDAYDQLVVEEGTVQLSGAILRAIAYSGFELNEGDEFTIIDKQSDGAVNGTFADLPEGTTFAFGQGGVARISYVGGDGNDVTLTIVSVPTAPDTGFAALMAQPWLVFAVVAVAGLGLVGLGRKLQTKR